jgi:hypothetical protein
MTQQYVPGKGYTVRDSRGRVIAHSLTPAQAARLMACRDMGTISTELLAALTAA